MRSIWLVVKHDISVTLRQKSFWILTFLMPALLLAINAYSMFAVDRANTPETEGDSGEAASEPSGPEALPSIGLVDEGAFLKKMPPDFPEALFLRFADTTAAQAALDRGEIEQYVLLPADYLASGDVYLYARNFSIRDSQEDTGLAFNGQNNWLLQYLIDYNLSGDEAVVTALRNPSPGSLAERFVLQPAEPVTELDASLAELVSNVMPYVYYFLLLMGSNYLMRSVVSEKENRTVEVLLLSLDPRRLMIGKILASSGIMVLQVVFWIGGGMLVLNRGADLLQVAEFAFPPGFLIWALLFLVLGYLVFASAMAAAGAMAPNAREGGQMTWLLIIPLMPTLMFGSLFVEEPNNPLTLFLSLFPLSAPSAMVTRLAVGTVPLWQILISLAGLAVTAYIFVVLAARFFQAGNLLSDARFSWKRLFTEWRRESRQV